MQKIPQSVLMTSIDVMELNTFIENMSSHVFVFWIRLLSVNLNDIPNELEPSFINTTVMRLDDLELVYLYCSNLKSQVLQNKKYPHVFKNGKVVDAKWQKFMATMDKLDEKVVSNFVGFKEFKLQNQKQEPLIPENELFHKTI